MAGFFMAEEVAGVFESGTVVGVFGAGVFEPGVVVETFVAGVFGGEIISWDE